MQENGMTETRINIVGENLWSTFGFFSGNAYPGHTEPQVRASALQAAAFRYQVKQISKVILEDREYFLNQLLERKEDLTGSAKRRPDLNFVVYLRGAEYLSCLNGVLYSLKSFLDVYTQLMTGLISPSQTMTFKRANIEGEKLSGGSFINWLRHSSPKDFRDAINLSETIARHSRAWITEAVYYRDRLTHDGDIEGLTPMHVILKDPIIDFKNGRVKDPTMPDGTEVSAYCVTLLHRLEDFIDETLRLLPNVDLSLVHRGDFSRVEKNSLNAFQ